MMMRIDFTHLLHSNNVWPITLLLSGCSILASVLIVAVFSVLLGQRDNIFAFSMAVVCPTVIAPAAIYYSLQLARKLEESRQKVEKLNEDLSQASSEIEELSGLLPICSVCKKIRDDKGYWNQIETYLKKHSKAGFSHGYCPSCYEKEMARLKKWKEKKNERSGHQALAGREV